jgi:S1-C subfamily serine protease
MAAMNYQNSRRQKIAEPILPVTTPKASPMGLLIKFRLALLAVVTATSLLPGEALPHTPPQREPSRQPLTARQVARQVLPSVVYIEMEGQGGKPACYGSGFFVIRTQILTNKHVVTCVPGGHGRVKLAGGERSYPTGHILDMPDLDVALVEAEGLTAPPLPLDTARQLSVGDDIFVAGNPEGLEGTFTRGIISGLRSEGGLLQIDAPVSPGSSGGPVVDSYGHVVGLTVSSIREGQNLNFAIPAPLLASPLERMQKMMAQLRERGGASAAAKGRTSAPTLAPPAKAAPPGPARRAWESDHDWADFFSEVVGDTGVRDELKALLDSGVDVNARDRGGRAALHLAARLGQVDAARYLLSRGADINARDAVSRTPLMLAVGPGDYDLPAGFFAPLGDFWYSQPCGGSEIVSPSKYDARWPRWYVAAEKRLHIIRLLLEAGADLAPADNFGLTVYDHAARGGLTGFVRMLHAQDKSAALPACDVTLSNAPALRGLRLGMSASEVSARLGGLTPKPGRCGLSTLTASGNRLASPRGFEGVDSVAVVFLDGRAVYLMVNYGREFPFASFDEYLAALSSRLGLPRAWRRAAGFQGMEEAHAMTCDGFVAAAGHVGNSYMELHDTEAAKTLLKRDVEEDEKLRREEERRQREEQERRRQSFKP